MCAIIYGMQGMLQYALLFTECKECYNVLYYLRNARNATMGCIIYGMQGMLQCALLFTECKECYNVRYYVRNARNATMCVIIYGMQGMLQCALLFTECTEACLPQKHPPLWIGSIDLILLHKTNQLNQSIVCPPRACLPRKHAPPLGLVQLT